MQNKRHLSRQITLNTFFNLLKRVKKKSYSENKLFLLASDLKKTQKENP